MAKTGENRWTYTPPTRYIRWSEIPAAGQEVIKRVTAHQLDTHPDITYDADGEMEYKGKLIDGLPWKH